MGIPATRRTLLKLGLSLLSVPAIAKTRRGARGVVELFTSQGCSSCPPADAFFAELAERDDIVTLAYHVDYWDYLGWKDSLARPENADRQREYSKVFDSTVYTPQAVVNGRINLVGSDRAAILSALQEQDGVHGLSVDLDLSAIGGRMIVEVGRASTSDQAHIILVYYKPRQVVEIDAGENAGRTADYRDIVTSFQTVGIWHGDAMRLELPKSEMSRRGGRCAVLLQKVDEDGQPGPILGATCSQAV